MTILMLFIVTHICLRVLSLYIFLVIRRHRRRRRSSLFRSCMYRKTCSSAQLLFILSVYRCSYALNK